MEKRVKTLTHEKLDNLFLIFVEEFSIVKKLWEPDTDAINSINAFVDYVVLLNPILLLRPDNSTDIMDKIFSDTKLADFILNLSFRFYSLGAYGKYYDLLIDNLADGLSIDGPNPNYSLIPNDIKASMPVSLSNETSYPIWILKILQRLGLYELETPKMLLKNNKLLVIILMIYLTNTTNDVTESN